MLGWPCTCYHLGKLSHRRDSGRFTLTPKGSWCPALEGQQLLLGLVMNSHGFCPRPLQYACIKHILSILV